MDLPGTESDSVAPRDFWFFTFGLDTFTAGAGSVGHVSIQI
jgi:hypothetical protein